MEQSTAMRASRARRSRGYAWEDALVKRLRGAPDWYGVRLGSPSAALPDVLAVNNTEKLLMIIEAKSGTGTTLQVPCEQVERCMKWTSTLGAYETRSVVFAFKFLSKKRVGTATYTGRKLREFYKEWNCADEPISCVCTYEGITYALSDGERVEKVLPDFDMPFSSRWACRALADAAPSKRPLSVAMRANRRADPNFEITTVAPPAT